MQEIEYLKEKISKTGFPLEIEISSLLRDRWGVLYRESFFDREGKKMRDIDLRALYPFSVNKSLPLCLSTELDIECKRSENFAWIFFTVETDYAPEESIDGQYIDELQICSKKPELRQLRDVIVGDTRLHYHGFERFAVAFDEIYLKGKKDEYEGGKDEIFEAENQLKKFIAYTNEKSLEEKWPDMKRILFYFPCIVFDGKMFEATVENGKLELEKRKHIVLVTQYRPSYSLWEQSFLIDVVHKSYFQKYLRKIVHDITLLSENIVKNRNKLLKKIEDVELLL